MDIIKHKQPPTHPLLRGNVHILLCPEILMGNDQFGKEEIGEIFWLMWFNLWIP